MNDLKDAMATPPDSVKRAAEEAAKREKDRFAPLKSVLDLLEPASLTEIPEQGERIALSSAISLRRIADALEPTKYGYDPNAGPVDHDALLEDIKKVQDRITEQAEVESAAGNMLNLRAEELDIDSDTERENMAILIRRLASAVLRKATK